MYYFKFWDRIVELSISVLLFIGDSFDYVGGWEILKIVISKVVVEFFVLIFIDGFGFRVIYLGLEAILCSMNEWFYLSVYGIYLIK